MHNTINIYIFGPVGVGVPSVFGGVVVRGGKIVGGGTGSATEKRRLVVRQKYSRKIQISIRVSLLMKAPVYRCVGLPHRFHKYFDPFFHAAPYINSKT